MRITRMSILACVVALVACQTPSDGSANLSGGVRESRLSERDFELVTSVNGFTAPGQLQPQLLRRAQEVGGASGYATFTLHDTRAYFNLAGNSFWARARVKYYRPSEIPPSSTQRVYGVLDPIAFFSKERQRSRSKRHCLRSRATSLTATRSFGFGSNP